MYVCQYVHAALCHVKAHPHCPHHPTPHPPTQAHVRSLTAWTYTQLHALYHSNGAPVVQIFGRHGAPDAAHTQGGILNFELLQPDGVPFSYREIQEASAAAGFHLRTGSECNPGACYSYLGLTEAGMCVE